MFLKALSNDKSKFNKTLDYNFTIIPIRVKQCSDFQKINDFINKSIKLDLLQSVSQNNTESKAVLNIKHIEKPVDYKKIFCTDHCTSLSNYEKYLYDLKEEAIVDLNLLGKEISMLDFN